MSVTIKTPTLTPNDAGWEIKTTITGDETGHTTEITCQLHRAEGTPDQFGEGRLMERLFVDAIHLAEIAEQAGDDHNAANRICELGYGDDPDVITFIIWYNKLSDNEKAALEG